MKQLVIIRHAKSSWADMSLDDHDRPLNKRGHRNAPEMGRRLKERGIIPDLMISSTARRAHDTCTYIAAAVGYPEKEVMLESRLYHAGIGQTLEVINRVDDEVDTLFIFGHNPGFTSFANALNQTDIYNIPTAGLVLCQLPLLHWKDVTLGKGRQLLFDYPKKIKG